MKKRKFTGRIIDFKNRVLNTANDMKKDNNGFTLVEMIIVLAIIAILVAIIAPQATRYIQTANTTKSASTAKTIYTALTSYTTELMTSGKSYSGGAQVVTFDGDLDYSGASFYADWDAAAASGYFSTDLGSSDVIVAVFDATGTVVSVGYQPNGTGVYYIAPVGTTTTGAPTVANPYGTTTP